MAKKPPTVYVSAPQGAGKTRNAETLREMFGCICIVDEWDGISPVPSGALVLTNLAPIRVTTYGVDVVADGLWFNRDAEAVA